MIRINFPLQALQSTSPILRIARIRHFVVDLLNYKIPLRFVDKKVTAQVHNLVSKSPINKTSLEP
jgi:hypothetical protein